jgi:hypothetical protein
MGLTVHKGVPSRAEGIGLREALFSVQRALEDARWQNLSVDERTESESGFATDDERREAIKRARVASRRNPLAKQACSLLVNYVVGRGVTLSPTNRSLVARLVDEFWDHPVNRETFTSNRAMAEFLLGSYTDGVQYLVLFPDDENGTLELGSLDTLFVEDVITDPDNHRIPLWYKVRRPRSGYDYRDGHYKPHAEDKFVWYRHWQNDKPLDASGKKAPKKVEPGVIYPAKRGRGKHGESEMVSALEWLNAHKSFMEDRTTLTRAAAALAWKKKRRNASPGDVATEVGRIQSSLAASTLRGYETNPANAAGATIVENENSNTEWIKTDTGGQAALADERILRMMAGSGMGGVPNHYFGDEANANLASATSMELPLLKAYESWQQWLSDVIKDILDFYLRTCHEAGRLGPRDVETRYSDRTLTSESVLQRPAGGGPPPPPSGQQDAMREAPAWEASATGQPAWQKPGQEAGPTAPAEPPAPPTKEVTFGVDGPPTKPDEPVDWYVDVDFPPIVVKDVKVHLDALKVLGEMLPQSPEGQRLLLVQALTAFGVNDISQVLRDIVPALPEGMKPTQPTLIGPPQPPGQTGPSLSPQNAPPFQPAVQQPAQAREAFSPYRVHRFLNAVREAAVVLDSEA